MEMDHVRRGGRGRPLVEERQKFLELVGQGVSIREASRIVGINRRTGQEWVNGRSARIKTTVRPGKRTRPAIQPITGEKRAFIPHPLGESGVSSSGRPISRRYLSEEERIRIADLRREKKSIRSIAAELGRSPSTISREIRRNHNPGLRPSHPSYYRPFAAHKRAETRRARPKARRIETCPELREFIQARLDEKWSPEQIANILRRRFPDRPELHVTHETIYRALYAQARTGLWREVSRRLRTGRCMRKRRRRAQRQPRFTHPMVMISQRPFEPADRSIPGHWEGDLIVGARNGSSIGTLVERSTRYTLLVHLPLGHRPGLVQKALLQAVRGLPPHLKRSLTWDQGAEMAHHYAFSEASGVPVYFCEPHSPWQRGSNENTNGLLRQYFPKGTDLSKYSREDLEAAAAELNSRPRKTLGWDTPAERFSGLLQHDPNTPCVATIC